MTTPTPLERLAAKWRAWITQHPNASDEDETRWLALAFAEMLEEEATTIATERKSSPDQWRDTSAYRESARYLRGIAADE